MLCFPMAKPIRVLVADDHTIVRDGLRALLNAESDIQVIGEAQSGREAVQLARKLRPRVVVMDIGMPQLNGLEATRQITKENPRIRLLMLSMHSDSEYVRHALKAGAAGYLLKQSGAADLTTAVRELAGGRTFFSPVIWKILNGQYLQMIKGKGALPAGDLLTSREAEILQLVAEGNSSKQIAVELSISPKTVEKHREQLMRKLNIHEVASLTRYALAHGVVQG
jgi:DNA-binding NarL/FixJ family response regulator